MNLDPPVDLDDTPERVAREVLDVGTVVEVGRVPAVLLGGDWPKDVIGRSLSELLGDSVTGAGLIHALAERAGQPQGVRMGFRGANGADVEAVVECTPTRSGNRLEEVVGTARVWRADSVVRRRETTIRSQVARDVHDGIGQLVTAIRMLAEELLDTVPAEEQAAVRHARGIEGLAARARSEISNLEQHLEKNRDDYAGPVSLRQALSDLEARISILPGITSSLEIEIERLELPPSVSRALRFVAEEAVTNALRHGEASTVRIRVDREKDVLVFSVSDDGTGYQEPQPEDRSSGISHMRSRVEALGGKLAVHALASGGTEVTCRVPLLD